MGDIGISRDSLQRYIDEQIYTFPGLDRHREAVTILLTGSRATGTYTATSDVDLEVLCPQSVYDTAHRAALEAGLIRTPKSFFVKRPETDWGRYFGDEKGRPHFSVTSLRQVAENFASYRDVWLWVWTTSRVITDPGGQFGRIADGFQGYPHDVLVRKIKYHWLLAGYWSIDVFPLSSHADDMLLAAAAAILNTVNEHLRVFCLVEGRPFPYTEKLMRLAGTTALGREFLPMLQFTVDLVLGRAEAERPLWDRLEKAFEILNCYDLSEENRRLCDACMKAMVAAGVEPDWAEADYDNIDELLQGELGPAPE